MLRKYYSNPDGKGSGPVARTAANVDDEDDEDDEHLHDDALVRQLLDGQLSRLDDELIMLTGLLSSVPKRGTHRRLYLRPQMDVYVEFRRDDIRHSIPIPKSSLTPLGGSIVWLRKGASLKLKSSISAQGAQSIAAFLQGSIANSFMPGVGQGNQVMPTWAGCGTNAGGGGAGGSLAGCGSQTAAGCGTRPTPTAFPPFSCD